MNLCFYTLLLLAVGAGASVVQAQTPDYSTFNQVIGNTGQMITREGLTWAYTVGELVVPTFTDTDLNITLTQGFHQPETSRTVRILPDPAVDWRLEVFPNPTADVLHLRFAQASMRIAVTDVMGRVQVAPYEVVRQERVLLSCADWPPGIYVLHLQHLDTRRHSSVRVVVTDH